jgi:hypothetical protein
MPFLLVTFVLAHVIGAIVLRLHLILPPIVDPDVLTLTPP